MEVTFLSLSCQLFNAFAFVFFLVDYNVSYVLFSCGKRVIEERNKSGSARTRLKHLVIIRLESLFWRAVQ